MSTPITRPAGPTRESALPPPHPVLSPHQVPGRRRRPRPQPTQQVRTSETTPKVLIVRRAVDATSARDVESRTPVHRITCSTLYACYASLSTGASVWRSPTGSSGDPNRPRSRAQDWQSAPRRPLFRSDGEAAEQARLLGFAMPDDETRAFRISPIPSFPEKSQVDSHHIPML